MKKIKYLFLILLTVLILPFGVFAEGEETEEGTDAVAEDSKEVVVYFFRGEGCSHCAEAEEWFNSIEEELGDKFRIQDYETWYNTDNSELMTKVAEFRNESEDIGVPYILIGDQSWIGFDQSYTDEIKDKINEVYEQDVADRYDVMSFVDSNSTTSKKEKKSSSNDVVSLIIILVICGGVGTGIYFARKQNAE